MAKDPAVLLYIANWLIATAEMTPEGKGYYITLLLHNYDKKSLPSDVESLASLCNVKYSDFKKFEHVFKQELEHKFEHVGENRISNTTTMEILRAREQFKDKKSFAGKKSYVTQYFKKNYPQEFENEELREAVLNEFDYSIDLKDIDLFKNVFEHVFKQKSELYININIDINKNINLDKNINLEEKEKNSKKKKISEKENFGLEKVKKEISPESENLIEIRAEMMRTYQEWFFDAKGFAIEPPKSLDWAKLSKIRESLTARLIQAKKRIDVFQHCEAFKLILEACKSDEFIFVKNAASLPIIESRLNYLYDVVINGYQNRSKSKIPSAALNGTPVLIRKPDY